MRFLLFLLLPWTLQATYVGNPASPGLLQTGLFSVHNYLINVATGYVYDISWDKKIAAKDPSYPVDEFTVESNWSAISLTLLRRLSVYSYLGVSKETMQWDQSSLSGHGGKLKTKNHFSYSVGTKVILLQFGSTKIALDAQYFSLPSSSSFAKTIGSIYWAFDPGEQSLSVEEWHIALGFVRSLGPFSAYLGGKYSQKDIQVFSEDSSPTLEFSQKVPVGLFGGLSLNVSRGLYLNLGGRLFDEYALSFAAIAAF
ncbi:MAG: hypothetical protein AAGI90_03595 [Chlamydiota bacterium]